MRLIIEPAAGPTKTKKEKPISCFRQCVAECGRLHFPDICPLKKKRS